MMEAKNSDLGRKIPRGKYNYRWFSMMIGENTQLRSHFLSRRRPARTGVADRKWGANVTIIGETDQIFARAKSSPTFPWAGSSPPAAPADHQHGSGQECSVFPGQQWAGAMLSKYCLIIKTGREYREKRGLRLCHALLDVLAHTSAIINWSHLTSVRRLITSSFKKVTIKFAGHFSRIKEMSQQ